MHLFLAALVTGIVYFFANRMSAFATKDYNTQAYVNPESIPDRELLDKADQVTNVMNQANKIPMAQIASPFGELYTPNRLNPSLPPVTYGNTMLDMPTVIMMPNKTG